MLGDCEFRKRHLKENNKGFLCKQLLVSYNNRLYTQTSMLVSLILRMFFVISRHHQVGFRRKLPDCCSYQPPGPFQTNIFEIKPQENQTNRDRNFEQIQHQSPRLLNFERNPFVFFFVFSFFCLFLAGRRGLG